MLRRGLLLLAVGWMVAWTAWATETEHLGLSIVPAPGPVTIDGQWQDWDLSGAIFTCSGVETNRDTYSVWLQAMYDAQYLYVLARWSDPTPLNHPGSAAGDHGFAGDCLQFRAITAYEQPTEKVTHWTCWRDREQIGVVHLATNRDFKGPELRDAQAQGAKQAFYVYPDGRGYGQELALPWALLTQDGQPLQAGQSLVLTVEPNFTAGTNGRISIKDIFRPGLTPDRVFTFRAYKNWGIGVLEEKGKLPLRPTRLADGREFPVTWKDGLPATDWSQLRPSLLWPGFKELSFTMPFAGYASLHLRAADGTIVRQLLTEHPFEAGTHTIAWDGLTTPLHRQPGEVAPAGEYTWQAIAHQGFGTTLRGWASHSGRRPWTTSPLDEWGGDHGVPSAVVADAQRVYLAWNGAEGGKHLYAVDHQGQVLWALKNTLGVGDPNVIAIDGGVIYVLHTLWGATPGTIARVNAETGVYAWWPGRETAGLNVPELWPADRAADYPDHVDGLDARDGKLYVTSSDPRYRQADVRDLTALLTAVKGGAGPLAGLWDKLPQETQKTITDWLAGRQKGEAKPRGGHRHDPLENVMDVLNGSFLREADLATAQARRTAMDQALGAAMRPLKSNFLAIVDAQTAKVTQEWPLVGGTFVRAVSPELVYVITGGIANEGDTRDGRAVVALNPQTGAVREVVSGLRGARALAVAPDGRLLVSCAGDVQQVLLFTPDGKPAGAIGQTGGRPRVGPYQAGGMVEPMGVAVDSIGQVWTMEAYRHPKRVSVWRLADGGLVREFFGMTHYGASGGAINPRDPDLMIGVGCEWRIDPKTGRAACLGAFDTMYHTFATFREGSNGRQYLYTTTNGYGSGSIRIFERLGDGDYALRAELRGEHDPESRKQATKTYYWADENGDRQEQPEEIQEIGHWIACYGSLGWSICLGLDSTLFGYDPQNKRLLRLPLAGYTKAGAPRYDIGAPEVLPPQYAEGYQLNYSAAIPDASGKRLLTANTKSQQWQCFDLATHKLLWTYPNPYFQVHGSHRAPTPEPGIFRGAYGPIGTVELPAPLGTVWFMNANLGEWYMLTGDGFYLGHLWEGDPTKTQWPPVAEPGADLTHAPPGSGGEDFGGSVQQGRDGKVYVQSGKGAVWNTVMHGLDKVVAAGSGKLTLTEADRVTAAEYRERALQAAAGTKRHEVLKATPTFTGNLGPDFAKQPRAEGRKGDAVVVASAAWDANCLYLAWQVQDPTPWVNGAKDFIQMYSEGDTVDFQFGANPKADPKRGEGVAGDVRLSIGPLQGKPTAVLYRKVSAEKRPRVFSSGVTSGYTMEYADLAPEVRIEVKVQAGKGYLVEAAVPWSLLGGVPQTEVAYRGDFGITCGDPGGQRTRLRVYWNNQQTGLVDDVVYELQMTPRNWGELVFKP